MAQSRGPPELYPKDEHTGMFDDTNHRPRTSAKLDQLIIYETVPAEVIRPLYVSFASNRCMTLHIKKNTSDQRAKRET